MMPLALLRQYRRVYLATPYTLFPDGHAAAHAEASRIAGELVAEGVRAFSPIAHSHSLCQHADLDPLDHELWLEQDEAWMEICCAMVIVEFEGWENSFGIAQEADYFRAAKKPIHRLDPKTMELR